MSDDEQRRASESRKNPQNMQLWQQQQRSPRQSLVRRHMRRMRRVIHGMSPSNSRSNQVDLPHGVHGHYQRFDDIYPQRTQQLSIEDTPYGRDTGYEQPYDSNDRLGRSGETGTGDQDYGAPIPTSSWRYMDATDESMAHDPYNYGESDSDSDFGAPIPMTSQQISKHEEKQYQDIDYRPATDENFERDPYNYGEQTDDSHTPKKYDTSSGNLFEGPDGPEDTIRNDRCRMMFLPFPSRTSAVRSRSLDDISRPENQQQFYPLRRTQPNQQLNRWNDDQSNSDGSSDESEPFEPQAHTKLAVRRSSPAQLQRTPTPFVKHYRKLTRVIRRRVNPDSVYRPRDPWFNQYQLDMKRHTGYEPPYDGPIITEITDDSDLSDAGQTQNMAHPNRMTVSADIHEPPNSNDRFRLKFVPIPDTRPSSSGETHRSPAVIGSTLRSGLMPHRYTQSMHDSSGPPVVIGSTLRPGLMAHRYTQGIDDTDEPPAVIGSTLKSGLTPHSYIQGMDDPSNRQFRGEAGTSAEDLGDPIPAPDRSYTDTDYSEEIDESMAHDPYNYGESGSDSDNG